MNRQRWLSQNFFMFFMTWGVFLPYWTGWLVQAKGLSVAEASLIMGFGLVARGASTLFAFPLVSKFWSSQRVLLILTIGSFLVALLYIPATSFTILFVVTILFSAVYPALLPAVESTATILIQQGDIHYGKSRKYGSIGFVVSVLIISMVTGYFGERAILWSMIAGLCLMLVMRLQPAPAVLLAKPMAKHRKKSFSMRGLWQVRSFPIVLLVVVLLQGAHASYYNYGFIYLQDLGVNNYSIGLILNIAVIFEILYFAKADHLFRGWKPSSLFIVAAVGSSLRWVLIFLFPNVWIFMLSQSLHAVSFGIAHFAFIQYITKNLPTEQIPNAQGVYSAVALSFSTAVLTLLGGYLYEFSPGLAFLGMILFTVPVFFLLIGTRKHYVY